jgi:hypothetical protein
LAGDEINEVHENAPSGNADRDNAASLETACHGSTAARHPWRPSGPVEIPDWNHRSACQDPSF